MEVRDPVHGSIAIQDSEIPIVEHLFFQRLRNIKQLGFSEFSFPGATHTRYIHSLGVMNISTMAFDRLFKNNLSNPEVQRLRQTLRMGCLLHDIGHAPLSHSTESVMPLVKELELPSIFMKNDNPERQATHEDYTVKSIADSSFTKSFDKIRFQYGIEPFAIAELVLGKTSMPEYFTLNGVNYFPILHQLVSSEIDCDRMDYLLRDSYFCGVSYGQYDLDWILENLEVCYIGGEANLGISEKAVSTFDDFLLSRFHMFLMVYFHYRAVCLEQMLYKYFETSDGEYTIPACIEAYQEHDDHLLSKFLRKSENKWAQKIVRNQIPRKIFESFSKEDEVKVEKLESFLKENEIDYIKCSSKGRLSKYYESGPVPY
jgi:HD superfamily phosphohydrolase